MSTEQKSYRGWLTRNLSEPGQNYGNREASVETDAEKKFRREIVEMLAAFDLRSQDYHYQQTLSSPNRKTKTTVEGSIRLNPWDPEKAKDIVRKINQPDTGYSAKLNLSNISVKTSR